LGRFDYTHNYTLYTITLSLIFNSRRTK